MKFKTTILLLIAVLVLGAFIGLFERRTGSTREREEQARKALPMRADRVSYLKFEATNLLVECVRDDGTWMVVRPVRARADAAEIGRLLAGLEDLPRGEVITPAEQKARGLSPAQYGLEPPRARITLGDSLHRRTIHVGADARLGGSVYIREETRDDIVATETNLFSFIPKAVSDVRDRTLFLGSPEKIQRLEISVPAGFLQVVNMGGGRWSLQQPFTARASPITVQEILESLFDLRVEDFVADGSADLVAYGLDEPALKVGVWSREKEGETALLFGDLVAKSNALLYAKRASGDSIVAVPTNILGRLRVSVEDLRDRRLIPLSQYDLAYVRVEEGETSLELRKAEDGSWQVTEPKQWKADGQRVRDLLNAWANARIVGFVDDAPTNLAVVGLAPPAMTLTFARKAPAESGGEEAAPARSLEEGADVLVSRSKRELGRTLVRLEQDQALYEILTDVLNTVSTDPLFFRDREVVSLDPEDIVRITVSRDGGERTVERTPGGTFAAVPAAAGEPDQDAIKDLLMTVSRLRAAEFAADSPEELSRYGLDAPRASLTLGLKGESGIAKTILFGADAGGQGVYAMVRGQDVVFVIDPEARGKLLQGPYTVQEPTPKEPVDLSTNKPSSP